MVLKAVNLSCSLGMPNNYHCSSSSSAYSCKVPVRLDARIGCLHYHGRVVLLHTAKKHRIGGTPLLKCTANSRSCLDAVVQPDELTEIPLVPYPSVLLPGATLQLQMFEFRYRIMMHSLLQGDLRFGITYSHKSSGMADVGCMGHVLKYERLVDDRFFLVYQGRERFRVVDVVRTKPYLVARVKILNDEPNPEHDLEALAREVEDSMKDVIRLSYKLDGKPRRETEYLRGSLSPASFSFVVASSFEDNPGEQQALLQLEDTALRLIRERDNLLHRCKYLAAASAVTDAFEHLSFNEN